VFDNWNHPLYTGGVGIYSSSRRLVVDTPHNSSLIVARRSPRRYSNVVVISSVVILECGTDTTKMKKNETSNSRESCKPEGPSSKLSHPSDIHHITISPYKDERHKYLYGHTKKGALRLFGQKHKQMWFSIKYRYYTGLLCVNR